MLSENGTMVLFHSEGKGTVVAIVGGADPKSFATYSDDWYMEKFKPWRGTVTLTQD